MAQQGIEIAPARKFCDFRAREGPPAAIFHEIFANHPPTQNLTSPRSSSNKFCGHQGSNNIILECFSFALTKPQRNTPGRSRATTENVSDHRIVSLRHKFGFDHPAENNTSWAETASNHSVSTSHLGIERMWRRKALKSRQRRIFVILGHVRGHQRQYFMKFSQIAHRPKT